ncbi:MAG: GntR family transcriptional regulator [Kiritimatiellae bacterium]|nr:GntR family transcriptional regulator [Kiritimatiellia bacterium]
MYEALKADLRSGRFPFGRRLPAMNELVRQYQVSINSVCRAIELLKEEKLVRTKVGDGIYSMVPDLSMSHSKIENMDIPYIVSSKKIKVWIEDPKDWQVEFWRRMLTRFQEENPDIALELCFGLNAGEAAKDADLLLGGLCFLYQCGVETSALLSYEDVKSFRPHLYENKFMSTDSVVSDKGACFFPFGFNTTFILGKKGAFPQRLRHCADILEFMKKSGDEAPFLLWSIGNCLASCGCCFKDVSKGQYEFRNRAKWKNVLNRLRDHMKHGNLLWKIKEGYVWEGIIQKELGASVRFMEIDIGGLREIRNLGLTSALEWIPYPTGTLYWLFSKYAGIVRRTSFPDECLRILEYILRGSVQQELLDQMIAMPIDRKVMEENGYQGLSEGLAAKARKDRIPVEVPFDLEMHFAVEKHTLMWDIYYYLIGKAEDDVIECLERKIRYLMEVHRKRIQAALHKATRMLR